jgi:hypothetical protein
MEPIESAGAVEPQEWFVIFHPEASTRWLAALAVGRFKHVSAFAYVPVGDCWIFLDAEWSGLRIVHARHDVARAQIARYAEHCVIVRAPRAAAPMALAGRLGFTCVSAVRHLLGVRAWSLRPDALYRHLLANGGERTDDARDSGRPDAPAGAAAGAEQPRDAASDPKSG